VLWVGSGLGLVGIEVLSVGCGSREERVVLGLSVVKGYGSGEELVAFVRRIYRNLYCSAGPW
jgi:hypothetical protein